MNIHRRVFADQLRLQTSFLRRHVSTEIEVQIRVTLVGVTPQTYLLGFKRSPGIKSGLRLSSRLEVSVLGRGAISRTTCLGQ